MTNPPAVDDSWLDAGHSPESGAIAGSFEGSGGLRLSSARSSSDPVKQFSEQAAQWGWIGIGGHWRRDG